MAATGFGPEAFDAADPPAFYLGERREELESIADAAFIVQGTRLPVHTGMLAVASPVLCGAFAKVDGSHEQACSSCGHKRKHAEARQRAVRVL